MRLPLPAELPSFLGWGLHHYPRPCAGRTEDYLGRTSRLGEQLLFMLLPPPPGGFSPDTPGHTNAPPPRRGFAKARLGTGCFLFEPFKHELLCRVQSAGVNPSRRIPRGKALPCTVVQKYHDFVRLANPFRYARWNLLKQQRN